MPNVTRCRTRHGSNQNRRDRFVAKTLDQANDRAPCVWLRLVWLHTHRDVLRLYSGSDVIATAWKYFVIDQPLGKVLFVPARMFRDDDEPST